MSNTIQKLIQSELKTARLRVNALERALELFHDSAFHSDIAPRTKKKPGPKAKKRKTVKPKAKKVQPAAKPAPAVTPGTHAARIVAALESFISGQATIPEICGQMPKVKRDSLAKAIQVMVAQKQIVRVKRGVYALP